jgi:hypothetical protein
MRYARKPPLLPKKGLEVDTWLLLDPSLLFVRPVARAAL